ncbi:NnrS family protein [Dechloromonas sp. XY25]|uniref:NnrS family protein n=1 Tax=Dechloromonas hankyongensis TaxID=2908002 RepID=A0ABS9K4Q9_9RHOO|nr:NnrS family protein [Dechloromonas hankyongensis]MCG2578158.1 NnrS family protein [Dechloromonas hankyongensis]
MFPHTHPLWLVGFRPFFILACLAGMILPVAWALIFSGSLPAPAAPFTSVQWHAHEMFFGFGWAVLGGFLLTSTKNWVNIRGYHGPALMLLAGAWIVERLAMSFGGGLPLPLAMLANNAFLGSIALMLLWTLIRYRSQDSYRDNAFFMVMLPAFLFAKYLMLYGNDFTAGYGMAIALFRLAFLVMLERTLTGFMKAAFQTQILRQPKLDMPIKLLGLLLVFEFALPRPLTAALSLALAVLLLIRFAFWKPQLAFKRIDIGIMYVGYLAIVGQLLIEALGHVINFVWIGSVSVHLFTFGAMGSVIPAMIMRISKGHTGRKVVFDGLDRAVLYIMLIALAVRVVVPQFVPGAYLACIHAAATCWLLSFGIIAWRYIPMLMQPRIDGKEH